MEALRVRECLVAALLSDKGRKRTETIAGEGMHAFVYETRETPRATGRKFHEFCLFSLTDINESYMNRLVDTDK